MDFLHDLPDNCPSDAEIPQTETMWRPIDQNIVQGDLTVGNVPLAAFEPAIKDLDSLPDEFCKCQAFAVTLIKEREITHAKAIAQLPLFKNSTHLAKVTLDSDCGLIEKLEHYAHLWVSTDFDPDTAVTTLKPIDE